MQIDLARIRPVLDEDPPIDPAAGDCRQFEIPNLLVDPLPAFASALKLRLAPRMVVLDLDCGRGSGLEKCDD